MICGIALVKDELDVIGQTMLHMAEQVDHILVADNLSDDGTFELLQNLEQALPMTVISDNYPAHYQGRKLTSLARTAFASMGAEWIVPFDADELHQIDHDAFAQHPDAWIFTSELFEHVPTTSDDAEVLDPFRRLTYRRPEPLVNYKIVARAHRDLVIAEGSHSCHYAGRYPKTVERAFSIRHFPYRSPEQFVKKATNGYRGRAATDLGEDVSVHLRQFGAILEAEGEQGLIDFYNANLLQDVASGDFVLDPA